MSILIVNPFGIGDVLFTTPLIHTLKDAFPEGKLGFLCNKRAAPLLRNNPFINEIFIYERDDFKQLLLVSKLEWLKGFSSFIRQIKKARFDLAIDLSLSSNFGFFLWLAGIRKRIGYNYKNRGIYLTKSVKLSGYEDQHVVEYYNGLLELIGIEPKYQDLELYLSDEDKQCAESIFKEYRIDDSFPVIALSPGGGASWGIEAKIKRWPEEKFALLVNKIIEKYKVTVIILGDLKERDLLLNIETELQCKVINLAGRTTLTQSAAIINKADLFIGNDGGLLHIASALKRKTISFFGPVDPKVYGPYPPDETRHIVLRKAIECSPCYRGFRLRPCSRRQECLKSIEVEEVLKMINILSDTRKNGYRIFTE
ncbi:MAG: lipopolysaccharide heptosyltransferase II [Candidatus Omnitrophota bacterium]|nr:lipopolysaccharide heptosyltransferase II [Candidatus Omnitrophota bacterium]